jgi:succinyl-CoA synthetase beta subunit
MATLDNLALHGSSGGVFLDLGGTDDEKVVEGALSLLSRASQRVILVNIFGGITKCDTVAEGIVAARKRLDITTPIVARIRGVNEDRARSILAADGIMAFEDLDDACKEAARLEGA